MKTLGPITMDYTALTISFTYQGKFHLLNGVSEESNFSSTKAINKINGDEVQLFMLQVLVVEPELQAHEVFNALYMSTEIHVPAIIDALLTQYHQVFVDPTNLPPQRGTFDHSIPLQSGSKPINIRPYMYSSMKKDIIEKMVKDMWQV